jgi:hypothetical protein
MNWLLMRRSAATSEFLQRFAGRAARSKSAWAALPYFEDVKPTSTRGPERKGQQRGSQVLIISSVGEPVDHCHTAVSAGEKAYQMTRLDEAVLCQ